MYQQPTRISRYEIKTLIGAGGMGSLYLARDTNPNTNRLVALKLLNATLDSAELRERFGREARALAALNHPSIVDIYDSGEFRGSPYIVMEYVRGETLAESIKRRAHMSLTHKLKLMSELCSGLAHAHEAGIVHRDIKPANLMVDQHGRLKILDFGIARMHEASMTRIGGIQMTQVNMRIGTPGYMSPEQIEGGDIDRRSDIFAVGAVFYELLAFREAFSGSNTRQIETKVLESQPVPLLSIVQDLSPEIQAIIDKALAKDPRDRYQDATALEEALERQRWKLGLADTPTAISRPTPPARGSAARSHESRADAAYQRSQQAFREGAVETARRFAIEALAEDPDHADSRAFLERIGAEGFPLPPPTSAARGTAAPTMLADGSQTGEWDEAANAPTVLSAGSGAEQRRTGAGTSFAARHRKALQIAGIVGGVLLVLGLAATLAVSMWPSGPLLTVTRPTGGTVWTSGITCGTEAGDCTANISEGETIQLRAEPDNGYVFTGFSGDCTRTGRVHMTRPMTCIASFSPIGTPAVASGPSGTSMGVLTILKPENGTIVGPGGISCGSVSNACTAQYADGTQVVLRPIADPNYSFRGFKGDCNGKGELIVKGNRTCTAWFAADLIAGRGTGSASAAPARPSRPLTAPSSPGDAPGRPAAGSSDPGPVTVGPTGATTASTEDPLKPEPSAPEPEVRRAPPPPPLAPEVLAKKDIQQVLEEYRKAYEALDLKGIQRNYPGAPVEGLKRAFDSFRSLKYTFEGPPEFVDVDPSRGVATVKAKVLVAPESKVGSQKPFRREETFSLENRSGIWVIRDNKFVILK
jgi:serine/threonine protein kinase